MDWWFWLALYLLVGLGHALWLVRKGRVKPLALFSLSVFWPVMWIGLIWLALYKRGRRVT